MPVIRCRNSKKRHNQDFDQKEDKGGILFVLDGNSIYTICRGDRHSCKRWSKVDVSFPGIKIDFSKAALKQEVMPKNFRFPLDGKDIKQAPIIVEDE